MDKRVRTVENSVSVYQKPVLLGDSGRDIGIDSSKATYNEQGQLVFKRASVKTGPANSTIWNSIKKGLSNEEIMAELDALGLHYSGDDMLNRIESMRRSG